MDLVQPNFSICPVTEEAAWNLDFTHEPQIGCRVIKRERLIKLALPNPINAPNSADYESRALLNTPLQRPWKSAITTWESGEVLYWLSKGFHDSSLSPRTLQEGKDAFKFQVKGVWGESLLILVQTLESVRFQLQHSSSMDGLAPRSAG